MRRAEVARGRGMRGVLGGEIGKGSPALGRGCRFSCRGRVD